MLGRIVAKVQKSWQRRGLWGTCAQILGRISSRIIELTPAKRRERRIKEQKDREFDSPLGVDTGGIIHLNRLDIASDNRDLGVSYWASDPDTFRTVLSRLAIKQEDFIFIDFGSGKGRALMMAAEFPFRRIIGVEFAADLHAIATKNLQQYRAARPNAPQVDLNCMDALTFAIPLEPAILFFYNPFTGVVMENMVRRVQQSYEASPRTLFVVYVNPRADELWAQAPCLEKIVGTGDYSIYKSRGA